MDRLEHIFQLQAKFAFVSELCDLLEETIFIWWKKPKDINHDALREELVDILHFFISMCIKAGMTAEDLYQGYLKKNKENFDRQQGKSNKAGYEWEAD